MSASSTIPTDVVILAAGQGKRMASTLPKVLHPIGGKAMLAHVLTAARSLQAERCIAVIGHGSEHVKAHFVADNEIHWAEQHEQKGTGHAVMQALPHLSDNSEIVLVLNGDVPLVPVDALAAQIQLAAQGQLAVLTVKLDDPSGYGRIVRDASGHIQRIVEHKDATADERNLREINTGIYAIPRHYLADWLARLDNNNQQQEYYLTDIIQLALQDGIAVSAQETLDQGAVQGVNNRIQLASLEREYQQRQAEKLMLAGATLADPTRLDIRGDVRCGQDVFIDVNVVLEGAVTLADGVRIEPNCVIRNCTIGRNAQVLANSVLENSELGAETLVGPFTRLRPGTRLADKAKLGNFVEAKNAYIGTGSKANHLSYIGDATLGDSVNVGAGTIVCNYDGANKHKTVIEDDVFIGSNSALVAPLTIARGATVGAGSTINKDVSSETLALTRAPVRHIKGWQRPSKKPD